ncbi:MAG: SpoIIE family protein phosphatase [Beijerinckiaceae bacterium]|jgi:serine/threonine-protein kinase RsbW|nr:SpoIIE family protein phosphatase [Beijerinckiaceae bacterium]
MILFDAQIPPDLQALSLLRKDVAARLQTLCPNEAVRDAILLSIAEMGANAIRHGDPEPTKLGVRLLLEGSSIVIEIIDDGGAFEGFQRSLANSRMKRDHLFAESGRGLSIIESMLDEVIYEPGPPNRFVGKIQMGERRPTLLVVEDSPLLLETYAAMLSQPYRVLKAASLDSAIQISRAERIDGIVTDLHLEGRQGSELVDILEGDIDRPPVPVMVITGERDTAILHRVSEAGVEQVLFKPVSAETLHGAVTAMLARSIRQHARIFRYFGGSIDQEGDDRLPEHLGPFRTQALSARAGFGRGDFLSVLRLDHGKRIVLADVMGHGLSAQLAGMRFKAAIRGIHGALPHTSAGELIAATSSALCREPVLPGSFLTMMVVDLLNDGRVELAGAGHPRAIVASPFGIGMVETDGPLPGLIEGATYDTVSLELAAGERLYIPTDGVDPRADNAGTSAPAWLTDVLAMAANASFDESMELVDATIRQVLTHSPVDDWTLLVIEPCT